MVDHLVIWSPEAKATYLAILEYLADNWTFREVHAFVHRTERVIGHISENPFLFRYSKKSDTHQCVVVKQVSLFYRINDERIEILVFWDTRQNPAKLSL